MPMAEFEPGSFSVGSDRSSNYATTTAIFSSALQKY